MTLYEFGAQSFEGSNFAGVGLSVGAVNNWPCQLSCTSRNYS